MPKILKLKVKKLESKVAYCCDVSGGSLAAILVVLRNPTTRLNMDSESVRKMKTYGGNIGLRYIYRIIDVEIVCWRLKITWKKVIVIFLNQKLKKKHVSHFYWVWHDNETVFVKLFNGKWFQGVNCYFGLSWEPINYFISLIEWFVN